MSSMDILKEIRKCESKEEFEIVNIMDDLNKRMHLQSENRWKKEERNAKIFGP